MFSTFEKPHCSVVVRNIAENVSHSSALPLNVGRSLLDVLAIILCRSDGVLQLAIASRMASDKVRANSSTAEVVADCGMPTTQRARAAGSVRARCRSTAHASADSRSVLARVCVRFLVTKVTAAAASCGLSGCARVHVIRSTLRCRLGLYDDGPGLRPVAFLNFQSSSRW